MFSNYNNTMIFGLLIMCLLSTAETVDKNQTPTEIHAEIEGTLSGIYDVDKYTANKIAQIGDNAEKVLCNMLEEDGVTPSRSLQVLQYVSTKESTILLLQYLGELESQEKDAPWKTFALRALKNTADKRAGECLWGYLVGNDTTPSLRLEAAAALLKCGSEREIRFARRYILNTAELASGQHKVLGWEKDETTKLDSLIQALCTLGTDEAVEYLLPYVRKNFPNTRAFYLDLPRNSGKEEDLVDALLEYLEEDATVDGFETVLEALETLYELDTKRKAPQEVYLKYWNHIKAYIDSCVPAVPDGRERFEELITLVNIEYGEERSSLVTPLR